MAHASGWITNVDISTELGRKQSYYIRVHSGRHFTMSQAGSMQTFEFPAGERCFRGHTVSLDRPALYLKQAGDWRERFGTAQRMKPADWVDDFAEHQDNLTTKIKRG